MGRPATGNVDIDRRTSSPTFSLRFTANGKRRYVKLGTAAEGWTPTSAHTELQNVLADVRRGIWQPASPPPAPEIKEDPTFHKFATDWFEAVRGELRPKTVLDYEWQLSCHLLPFFRTHRLSQITVQEVDRYRQTQVRRDQISPSSINQDDYAARADPRGSCRVRADRPQPGEGTPTAPEGGSPRSGVARQPPAYEKWTSWPCFVGS